jgi:L-fucose mutarotase/ribose pyranase (RbsD/FucU family)
LPQPLERFAFYERANEAFAIIQVMGERRPCASSPG